MNKALLAGLATALLGLPSCGKLEITHKVEPIHMTVDINIRVDRQLENFFAFDERTKPATQPTTRAADGQSAATDDETKGAAL